PVAFGFPSAAFVRRRFLGSRGLGAPRLGGRLRWGALRGRALLGGGRGGSARFPFGAPRLSGLGDHELLAGEDLVRPSDAVGLTDRFDRDVVALRDRAE